MKRLKISNKSLGIKNSASAAYTCGSHLPAQAVLAIVGLAGTGESDRSDVAHPLQPGVTQ